MSANPQQSTALATQKELGLALDNERQVIEALLAGSPIKPQKLIASVLVEVDKMPALQKCSIKSIIGSAVEIARMGLEVGGTLGDAYIVPYGDRAQPIVGYKGYVNLVQRSGFVRAIEAHVVYENDEFNYELGTEPMIKHRPALRGPRGEILCFYAVATMADGTRRVEIMTVDQVNEIRDRSQAYRSAIKYANGRTPDTPWVTHYAEMGRKTAIRRIAKQLPKSAAIVRADELEAAQDAGEPIDTEQTLDVPYTEVHEAEVQRSDGSTVNRGTGEVANFMRPWPGQMTSQLRQEIIEAGAAVGLDRDALDDLCHGLDLPGDPSDYDESHYEKLSRALAAKRNPKKPGW